MQHIVVDDVQARIINEAVDSIEIRDRSGRRLGYVAHGFIDEDIQIVKQRLASDEVRYSTEQVLAKLQSMSSK